MRGWLEDGESGAVTVTVMLWEALPPAPVQVKVYVVVAAGLTVCEPEVDLLPDQPPEAIQDAALVEDQVRVTDWSEVTEVGAAVRVRMGVWGG